MSLATDQPAVVAYSPGLPTREMDRSPSLMPTPSVISYEIEDAPAPGRLEAACTILATCFVAATVLGVSVALVRIVLGGMMRYSGFELLPGMGHMY